MGVRMPMTGLIFIQTKLPSLLKDMGIHAYPAVFQKVTIEIRNAGVMVVFEPADLASQYCCRYSASFAAVERAKAILESHFPQYTPKAEPYLLRITAAKGDTVVFETQAHLEG